MTPDDVVSLHQALHKQPEADFEVQSRMQPRPNVLFELGMAFMAFRDRTLVVEVGQLRPISGIHGRDTIQFDGKEVGLGKFVSRLRQAGCALDDSGLDWRDASVLEGFDAYTRYPPA